MGRWSARRARPCLWATCNRTNATFARTASAPPADIIYEALSASGKTASSNSAPSVCERAGQWCARGCPTPCTRARSTMRQPRCYNGRQRLAFSEEGRVSICSPASLAESCQSLTAQMLCGRSGHDLAQLDFGSSRDGLQNGGWAVPLASVAPHFCAAPMPKGWARGHAQKVPTKHIESCV